MTIDTVGRLPLPAEVRAFVADERRDKRAAKIDELLADPLHAALWATKFCDITGNNTLSLDRPFSLQPRASHAWHDWFRKRIRENVPYDEIVHGVLCATSREGDEPAAWIERVRKIDDQLLWSHESDYAERKTLDLYWRRQIPVTSEQWGERTAAAFMGVRLECAQCHKHPFDRWTQADYRAYANVFGAHWNKVSRMSVPFSNGISGPPGARAGSGLPVSGCSSTFGSSARNSSRTSWSWAVRSMIFGRSAFSAAMIEAASADWPTATAAPPR